MSRYLEIGLQKQRLKPPPHGLAPHILFPRKLPSESFESVTTSEDFNLLALMSAVVHDFTGNSNIPVPKTLKLFSNWEAVQQETGLEVNLLTKTIQEMEPGDSVAMYISAQNAGLMFTRPKTDDAFHSSDQLVLSTFAASQSNETVMGTEATLQSVFPGFSYHIPKSALLESQAVSNRLWSLGQNVEPEAAAQTSKSGQSHAETRNVMDPLFITQWLPATLSTETSELCTHFQPVVKKIRDKVVVGMSTLPFRRSGMWMTAKVVLHLSLINEMSDKSNATFLYKMILLKLAMTCAEFWRQEVDVDTTMQLIVKIARRMAKLHHYALKNQITGQLKSCFDVISSEGEKLVLKIPKALDLEWMSYISVKSRESKLNYQTPLDFHQSTVHALNNLKKFLEKMNKAKYDSSAKRVPNLPCPPRHKKEPKTIFPVQDFSKSDEESLGILFNDFERNMEQLEEFYQSSDVLVVQKLFETYVRQAKSYYKDDPVGGSHMVLTLLQIIKVVDEATVKTHPLLLQYESGVDPSIFQELILPSSKDMKMANNLENYFENRNNRAKYSAVIRQTIISDYSFSVRYAAADSGMQLLKERIQTVCRLREEEKKSEVLKRRKLCETQREEAALLKCEYSTDRYGFEHHNSSCKKCSLEKSAKNACVNRYERMLPANISGQNAAVFELMIPTSIACLRDMLFQFTEICTSTPSKSGQNSAQGFWVNHLDGYRLECSRNQKYIKLGSSTKLFLATHYNKTGLHPDSDTDSFIVNNGYNCRYYYRDLDCPPDIPSGLSVKTFCTFQVNPKSAYRKLQFTVSGTTHSQNQVLAQQIDCPKDLSLSEFLEFGSLRAGHRLQWHNIHRALVQGTLSLEHDSVFSLICQAIWQAGPKLPNEYWRESDLSIIDPNFALKMLDLLESELKKNSWNWKNDYFMAVLIVLTSRIFSISPVYAVKNQALKFLRTCRQVTADWCCSIEGLLTKMTAAKKEELKEMRMKLVQISALSALTFTANPEDLHLTLCDSADVQSWLKSVAKIHDNILLTESSLISIPTMLRNLLRWVRKIGVELEDHFQSLSCVGSGFKAFVVDQLSLPPDSGEPEFRTYQYEIPGEQVYRAESETSVYQVDIITGRFHVNGKPVGKLPYTITSHSDFQRVFSGTIFEVREAVGANCIPGSVSTVLKFNKCIYNFFMTERNELIIREFHDNGDVFELVSNTCFEGDIPHLLVTKFSHWRHLKNNIIHFRPVNFLNPRFTEVPEYTLNLKTSKLLHISTNRNIVDINSSTFQNLAKIMERLEHINQILIFSDRAQLIAELPRIALHFYVSKSGVIESKEYNGMKISNTQQISTLIGLQHGLLLTSLEFDDYKMAPVLLVPNGPVSRSSGDATHHRVSIDRATLGTPQYLAFEVDHRMKRLRAGQSRVGWLYLAYLHAVTASPMPDPFTEMTGTEVALQLLQSPLCWSCEPLDSDAIDILGRISKLSPQRFFYPSHLKVQERTIYPEHLSSAAAQDSFRMIAQKIITDSERLHFLFPKPANSHFISERGNYCEELCRRAYRSHELVSNEHSRIDPTFLEISAPPEAKIVPSGTVHVGLRDMEAVRKLAQCCSAWTCTPVLNSSVLTRLMGNLPTLKMKPIRIEPTFYTQADYFKEAFPDSWFNLYEIARVVKTRHFESEWTLLLCQLAFGSGAISLEYLQALHAIAVNPDAFNSQNPPLYTIYTSTLNNKFNHSTIVSIAKNCAVKFDLYYDKMKDDTKREGSELRAYYSKMKTEYENLVNEQSVQVASKLEERWPINTANGIIKPCCVASYEVIKMSDAQRQIESHLAQWFANYKLHLFLNGVECILQQISKFPYSVVTTRVCAYNFANFEKCRNVNTNVNTEKPKLTRTLDDIIKENHMFVDEKTAAFAENVFITGRLDSDKFGGLKASNSGWIEQFSAMSLQHQNGHRGWAALLLNNVKTAILTSTNFIPFKNVFAAAGLFPRLTPTTLIPKLISEHLSQNRFYHLLGAIAVLWTLEQQQIRCEKYKTAGEAMEFALKKEMENNGHDFWNPAERPEWLLLELEMDIMIREMQVEVAERMLNPLNNKSSLMQLNMGEGKTSVILPILIATLANGNQLARVTVLRSLFHTNTEVLRFNLGGLLKRRLYNLPCRRDRVIGYDQCRVMLQVYEECMKNRGFVVTLPEHRLSFQLKGYEKCRASSKDGPELVKVQEWLYDNARDVLDESDEILNVKYQLIYTIGEQLPIDGGSARWTVLQKVLKLVPKHLMSIIKSESGISDQAECRHLNQDIENGREVFPQCRIFKADCYEDLCNSIVADILSGNTEVQFPELNPKDRARVAIFLTKASLEKQLHGEVLGLFQQENFSTASLNTLLILRGLLACGVLLLGLSKRWRVNYGENPKSKEYSRLMAVPYRAKDVASEKTEFGHPDVAILLTQLSFYYSGLTDFQLQDTFTCLYRQSKPELEYTSWVSLMSNVETSISSLSGVNLDDYEQRTKILFPALRRNTLVIDFWLNHFVYPRESKVFGHKLMCSPWDLSSDIAAHPVTGFSGTNGTARLLPLHITQNDLPKLENTNEKVRGYILQDENNFYEALPAGISGLGILQKLVELEIPLLLDVGALILELSNVQVAEAWLKLLPNDGNIEAAVYFDEMDRLMVKDRDGRESTLELSPYRTRLGHCVIYLDDVHTRGTDLKLPPGTKGCVTLGKGVTRDKLVQGCMRMRQLGYQNGHSLQFFASHEVHNEIKEIQTPGSKSSERVMNWAALNSEIAIKDGFLHWVNAGTNYIRKRMSHDLLLSSSKSESDYLKYGDRCSDAEATKLMAMYGEFRQEEFFYNIADQRLKNQECSFQETFDKQEKFNCQQILKTLSEGRVSIVEKCQEHIPEVKKLAYLLDEEQERELEHELEEERQAPRPAAAKPRPDQLDPALLKFVESDTPFESLNSCLVPLTHALNRTRLWSEVQPDCWGTNIYATINFSCSIMIPNLKDCADQYLRPPNWIASFKAKDQTLLILLSPFEANELMPIFRTGKSRLKLHMFAARLHPKQDTLIQTPELWIPSTTSNFNVLQYFQQFNQLNSNLLLFSGSQYFSNADEQTAYCQLTGYIPRPRSAEEQTAFDNDWTTNGFVKPEYRQRLNPSLHANCHFRTNPEKLILGIIERRHESSTPKCHVNRVVSESAKERFESNSTCK